MIESFLFVRANRIKLFGCVNYKPCRMTDSFFSSEGTEKKFSLGVYRNELHSLEAAARNRLCQTNKIIQTVTKTNSKTK